jgi:hypothetical protein
MTIGGTVITDSFYLRLWVKNTGNTAAKNVEIYASELLPMPGSTALMQVKRARLPMDRKSRAG